MPELIPDLRMILKGLEEGTIGEPNALIMLHGLLMQHSRHPRLTRLRQQLLADQTMSATATRAGLTLITNPDTPPET